MHLMTTSREHSRRRMKRIKRNAIAALLLGSLAATNSIAAEVQNNPYLVSQRPTAANTFPQKRRPTTVRPQPRRLPAVAPESPAVAVANTTKVVVAPEGPAVADELAEDKSDFAPVVRSQINSAHAALDRQITPVSAQNVGSRPHLITWLQSSTPSSERKESIQLLDQATREYNFHAWASAEATAWESLRRAAEGIDIAERKTRSPVDRSVARAARDLQIAREAIRKARDFSGIYGDLDADGVRRIVKSHRTEVLKHELADVPATDAIDRYLNEARVRLSRLAAYRVESAQAMDLLAAIHLGRGEPATLPSETALCLRRAALQGQPGNGSLALRLGMQLADLGLDQEARWALEHSLKIEPTREAATTLANVMQRAGNLAAAGQLKSQLRDRFPDNHRQAAVRIPEVVQLSPEEFATLSPSVIQATANSPAVTAHALTTSGTTAQATAAGPAERSVPNAEAVEVGQQTGGPSKFFQLKPKVQGVKRLLGPLGRLW